MAKTFDIRYTFRRHRYIGKITIDNRTITLRDGKKIHKWFPEKKAANCWFGPKNENGKSLSAAIIPEIVGHDTRYLCHWIIQRWVEWNKQTIVSLRLEGKPFSDICIEQAVTNLKRVGGDAIAAAAKRVCGKVGLIIARREHQLNRTGEQYYKRWLQWLRDNPEAAQVRSVLRFRGYSQLLHHIIEGRIPRNARKHECRKSGCVNYRRAKPIQAGGAGVVDDSAHLHYSQPDHENLACEIERWVDLFNGCPRRDRALGHAIRKQLSLEFPGKSLKNLRRSRGELRREKLSSAL